MPTFNCEKCKEGTLEFEVRDGDNGDGVWFQSFEYAELVDQTCKCEYSDKELDAFTDAAIEAEHNAIAEAEVNSLLAAHGL